MERYTSNDIVTLYSTAALPGTRINEVTGINLSKIYFTLHQEGVAVRPRGRQPVLISPGVQVLKDLLAQGFTQVEIAQKYDVSKRTIQRWLKMET